MTSVNVTTNKNTITVQEGDATTVTVSTVGPQGPQGVSGVSIIGEGTITEAKLDIHAAPSGTNKFLGYTSNGMEWAVPPDTDTTYSVGDNGLTENNFTDALKAKLDAIEASATADMTGSEIKTAYEAESNTNAFTDSEKTKLSGIATGAEVNVNTTYSISCVDGDNTDEEKILLTAGGDGSGTDEVVLEAGTGLSIARSGDKITFTNTVTDTNTQLTTEEVQDIIGAMVSSNTETNISVTYDDTNGKLDFVSTDTNTTYSVGDNGLTKNNFTDALKTKLDGIEASATADQTGAEIKSAYEGESNTNAFTDAEKTKLSGVAASANNYSISSDLLDEDNMVSNSATKVPSQQSVKAYVDANSSDTTYTAGTGMQLSGTQFSVTSLALTTVQTASSESSQLSLTTQEGDIVVRTDENKTYCKNSGTAGTMADFTLLRTPTDAVLSVNGNTGAITSAQIAAAVEAASDSNTFTDADHSKLNAIEASATADQTGAEIKTAYEAESNTNAFTDAEKSKLAAIEASATGDQTNAEIRAAVEAASDSNVFTDADHTKLNAIEASATADQTAAEIKTLLDSDGIVNAQVDASAAIAGTKISPDFGSQTIKTTGRVGIKVDPSSTQGSELAIKSTDGATNISLIPNADTEFTQIGFFNAAYDSQQGWIKYNNNDNSLQFRVNLGSALHINSSRNVGIGTTTPSERLDVAGNVKITGGITVTDKVTQTATAISALDIDCSTSNYFTKAISADSPFTFSNVPSSGEAYGFVLELDVSGDRTLTWPAAVKWAGGSAPTLTASKTHLFSFVTVDGGTTWRGSAAVDFTT
tara:strand:+ start:225 stop:2669 length:2445 start_codon:yes stop_codon:yes gene_type:complete